MVIKPNVSNFITVDAWKLMFLYLSSQRISPCQSKESYGCDGALSTQYEHDWGVNTLLRRTHTLSYDIFMTYLT